MEATVVDVHFPKFAKGRGIGFWLRPRNLIASRNDLLRIDNSNSWRYTFGPASPPDRSVPFSRLLEPGHSASEGFRFIIIADTGEGDRSQYGLLPLLYHFRPKFMIIVGDLANPAGRIDGNGDRNKDDYLAGFFEPYRNFGIPIWSVTGNHEYYARGQGKEYFDTFCTQKYASRWSDHGLRLVTQPGTYWELKEPDSSVVVIGLDTGKKGNLDGCRRFLSIGTEMPADREQYRWLEERLTLADHDKKEVVVLFHIPVLNKGKKDGKRMNTLYRILASHPCVKNVICGHEHSFQEYSAETVQRFFEIEFGCSTAGIEQKHIVNGGGGSALHATDFKPGRYQLSRLFPDANQWKIYLKEGGAILQGSRLAKSLLGKVIMSINRAYKGDGDIARFLSFILVTVNAKNVNPPYEMNPVWMEDLYKLYPPQTTGTVEVIDQNPHLYDPEVERCLKDIL